MYFVKNLTNSVARHKNCEGLLSSLRVKWMVKINYWIKWKKWIKNENSWKKCHVYFSCTCNYVWYVWNKKVTDLGTYLSFERWDRDRPCKEKNTSGWLRCATSQCRSFSKLIISILKWYLPSCLNLHHSRPSFSCWESSQAGLIFIIFAGSLQSYRVTEMRIDNTTTLW